MSYFIWATKHTLTQQTWFWGVAPACKEQWLLIYFKQLGISPSIYFTIPTWLASWLTSNHFWYDFWDDLNTALAAKLPMTTTLNLLIQHSTHRRKISIYQLMLANTIEGHPTLQSLAQITFLPPWLQSLFKVLPAHITLRDMAPLLAEHFQCCHQLQTKLWKTIRYPLILLGVATLMVIFMHHYWLPHFEKMWLNIMPASSVVSYTHQAPHQNSIPWWTLFALLITSTYFYYRKQWWLYFHRHHNSARCWQALQIWLLGKQLHLPLMSIVRIMMHSLGDFGHLQALDAYRRLHEGQSAQSVIPHLHFLSASEQAQLIYTYGQHQQHLDCVQLLTQNAKKRLQQQIERCGWTIQTLVMGVASLTLLKSMTLFYSPLTQILGAQSPI